MKNICTSTQILVWLFLLAITGLAQTTELKIGIIGTDTSHVPAFTKLLNDKTDPNHIPGARVVVAFKGGSPDVESSHTRVDKFAEEISTKYGVEIVSSIEELCRKVDAVLLESVDGRPHLAQIKPVIAAKKPVFVDKPFAASYRDAVEIVRLAKAAGVPIFSSSSLRYAADVQAIKNSDKHGGIVGAFAFGPENLEPHHPDLFWYGIHAVETLYALMGPGCESLTRVKTESGDIVTGKWKDGRIGTMRGLIQGKQEYGAIAFGQKATLTTPQSMKVDYRPLLVEIIKFFQTGTPPIQPEETLEIMAFMEAADLSKARGGNTVWLREVMDQKK